MRWLLHFVVKFIVALVALGFALILLYRWIDPPVTPLMLLRYQAAGSIDRKIVPLRAISPELQHAVIASEDNRFCLHHGIDWNAVSDAVDQYDEEGRLRGASTITMQVARNLFLWPGGGFFRKGIEAGLALTIDALWPKRRILEIYLNIAEWGDGIYGAEAASHAYFRSHAASLSRRDAALLAVTLPSPRRWSPARPTRYIAERAATIEARIGKLQGYYDCLR
jgi:monofunctional glycosyltransferase